MVVDFSVKNYKRNEAEIINVFVFRINLIKGIILVTLRKLFLISEQVHFLDGSTVINSQKKCIFKLHNLSKYGNYVWHYFVNQTCFLITSGPMVHIEFLVFTVYPLYS